ncbi:hypothetical protein ACLKA6_015717 [Drosophila palustris]
MWLTIQAKIFVIVIIALASQPLSAARSKHWKRAPVRGAFNVDVYAYNKPVVNLVGQQETQAGQVLPMGELLEQLSHSSRREMSMQKSPNYRNLDTDNYMARNQGVATVATANATAVADQIITRQEQSSEEPENLKAAASNLAINRQLAELQMNFSSNNSHAMRNLYSHEFHVQSMGKRKIVLLNTLTNGTGTNSGQDRKPDSAEVMSEPLNLKLALPQLPQKQKEEMEVKRKETELRETTTAKVIESVSIENLSTLELPLEIEDSAAISELQQMEGNRETVSIENLTTLELPPKIEDSATISELQQMEGHRETSTEEMPRRRGQVSGQLTGGTDDNKHGSKQAHNMTANAANADEKETQIKTKTKTETETEKETANDADVVRKNDNDGQVALMPQSVAVAVALPTTDKPPTVAKSKRKPTKKAKRPNDIDTKPSSSPTSKLTPSSGVGTVNVKAPVKESPEITTLQQVKGKGNGKGKGQGKGKKRVTQHEQEIETTTNWWHILPYAEIRKFLNTIYDSITDEDDDERRRRHRRLLDQRI